MNTIIILLGLFIAGFFLNEYYTTYRKNPESLNQNEIEEIFVSLKKRILATSHIKQEAVYDRLYNRLQELIGQILTRHQHFILDVEAKYGHVRIRFHNHSILKEIKPRPTDFLSYSHFVVPRNIELQEIEDDILLYLCFFLYTGGVIKNIGPVQPDADLMIKILDFLIIDRNSYPAIFLKGLVMKYGVTVDSQSFPNEAKTLLELANKNGIGSAAIELNLLHKYLQFEDIKPVSK